MRLRRFLFTGLGLAAAFLGSPGWAQVRPASTGASLDARAWLARVHEAASRRNYQGTQVFTAGGAVSSSRLVHYCDGVHQLERVDMLDGQMRRVLRRDDTVYTLWPQRRLAVVEPRESLAPFPALLQDGAEWLTAHYELQAEGHDRLAGHDADVLLLQPHDALRFAQRLWAERDSGLLLRVDVLGPHGEVLESSAFSDVQIDVRPQPEQVLHALRQLEGYRVLKPAITTTQLDREGWQLTQQVPGFRQVNCVKRRLGGAAAADGSDGGSVLQAVYSDGLTHVSVFVEPYDAGRHHRASTTSLGATHTLTARHGDWWLTVVGDVPVTTLKHFADALERRP